MMTTNHTPGPWRCTQAARANAQILIEAVDGSEVCRQPADAEGRANARLIAAAPDLLAALQSIYDACDQSDVYFSNIARTAIARAKGE
jgi:hypothetical protein